MPFYLAAWSMLLGIGQPQNNSLPIRAPIKVTADDGRIVSLLQCLIVTGVDYTVYARDDGALSVMVPEGRDIQIPGID